MEETCNVGKLWELNGYQGGSQPLLHNAKIAHNGNHDILQPICSTLTTG